MIFPAKGTMQSSYRLYEDDGLTTDYKNDISAFVNVEMKSTDSEIQLTIDKTGNYQLEYEIVTVMLPLTENRTVIVNGKELGKVQEFTIKL